MNRRGIPSTIEAVPAASQPNRILLRLSPEDAGLAKRIIGQQGCYCATDAEFLERLKVESFQSIVWEISNHVAVRAVAVPNEIVAWARRVPLLLHVAPSEAAMREIGDLAVSSSHLQVSICGRHDLEREIVSMLRSPADRGAEQEIVRCLKRVVDNDRACSLLTLAAIVGRRRTEAREFAAVIGVSERALHYRLKRAGLPTAKTLLRWTMALHTSWRRGVLGWAVKKAAVEAGFQTSAALSNGICRIAKVRPRDLTSSDFVGLMAQFMSGVAPFEYEKCRSASAPAENVLRFV